MIFLCILSSWRELEHLFALESLVADISEQQDLFLKNEEQVKSKSRTLTYKY